MYGTVDQNRIGVLATHSFDGGSALVGGAVIDDPKDATGIAVGGLAHDLIDESAKGRDAGPWARNDRRSWRDERPRPPSRPICRVVHIRVRLSWESPLEGPRRMETTARLNTGFLVSTKHELVVLQRLVLPDRWYRSRCGRPWSEIGIAGKDPTPMVPGANGILVQPTPNSRVADMGYQTATPHFVGQLSQAPARQRQALSGGQFTGQSLNLNHQFWGEKLGVDPSECAPASPANAFQKIAWRHSQATSRRVSSR